MVRRHIKHDDGMYHIDGQKYSLLEGTRAQVWHDTAYKTTGGLNHDDLTQNEEGRIVSKVKSELGKSQNNLGKFLQPKGSGKFGPHTAKKGGMKGKKGKKTKKGGMKGKKGKKGKTAKKH
jgi:hypothetical protein